MSSAVGASPLTRLSQMLAAVRPSVRVHVELSTFAEQTTLRQVTEHSYALKQVEY